MRKTITLLCTVLTLNAFSQPSYKNLVLEGGGVRGFAYVGAMQVLDSLGILQQVERVGGTSAGAIQATMLSIGYTPAEISEVIEDIPLRDFNDGSITGGISRMRRKFGFYRGNRISKWIEELVAKKTGDANITFMQLHQQKKEKNYKDLYITGTDLSYRCLRIFSYETYPNMRIQDALRISLSIPLYFEPVRMDDEGRIYSSKKNMTNLHLMVDGGLLSNYPVQIFDQPQYFACPDSTGTCPNRETLGLLLEKPEQLNYRQGKKNNPLPITNLNEYISAVYKTIIDRPNPDEQGIERTITISDLGLHGRVRKLPQSTIHKLIESGREGVRLFFRQKTGTQAPVNVSPAS